MYFQAANDCDLEPVAYEFFTEAFVLYEEEVAVRMKYICWFMKIMLHSSEQAIFFK